MIIHFNYQCVYNLFSNKNDNNIHINETVETCLDNLFKLNWKLIFNIIFNLLHLYINIKLK